MYIQQKDIEVFMKNNNIEGIDSSEVIPVSMGRNATAIVTKPYLFTLGLGTCIGLVGLAKNFGFLSHIDMGGIIGDQWETEYSQLPNGKWDVKPKKCKETWDLYNAIYRNKDKIKTPVDVILVEGISPVGNDDKHRKLLDSELDSLEYMCMKNLGVMIKRRIVSSSSILVDSRNQKIVLDNKQEIDMSELFSEYDNLKNNDEIDTIKQR